MNNSIKTRLAYLFVMALTMVLLSSREALATALPHHSATNGIFPANSGPLGPGNVGNLPTFKGLGSPLLPEDMVMGKYLDAVAAVSSRDVWAVGESYEAKASRTRVEHWNGLFWQTMPSPNAGQYNYLASVAVVNANDVWTVGAFNSRKTPARALIEHWNGSNWQIVPAVDIGFYDYLYHLTVISASNIWAVGAYGGINAVQTLTEHWNGRQWSIVSSPNAGDARTGNELFDVRGLSSGDVWAVGLIFDPSNSAIKTLAEHWNGSNWSIVASLNEGPSNYDYFTGVTTISTNDVWATGIFYDGHAFRGAIEHWDGTSWGVVPADNVGVFDYLLNIAAVSTRDIWAVGITQNSSNAPFIPLVEHWNGSAWRNVSCEIFGSKSGNKVRSGLYGVAVVSSSDAWAVGFNPINTTVTQDVIEHWDGHNWHLVPPGP